MSPVFYIRGKEMKKILLFICLFMLSCGQKGPTISTEDLQKKAKSMFGLVQEIKEKDDTFEKIDLGKQLYNEEKLSINDSQSCNYCHKLDNFGVDNKKTSIGALEEFGRRNSPTVYNAALHAAQFWDGRAKDLKEQAKSPILSHKEMAMKWSRDVEIKLMGVPEYVKSFSNVYKISVRYDDIADAIAAFERTLVSKGTSRFDKFQNGDLQALTLEEQRGLETFMNTGCASCHNGSLLGGKLFMKFGVINPYKNQEDQGRYEITKNESDGMVFKVPSLRNVAMTAPYFHDGGEETLKGAIKTMAWTQLGRELKDEEISDIEKFLNTLTD
jgi:cytochrome c peroxidase